MTIEQDFATVRSHMSEEWDGDHDTLVALSRIKAEYARHFAALEQIAGLPVYIDDDRHGFIARQALKES
jgi:hypothetical protein